MRPSNSKMSFFIESKFYEESAQKPCASIGTAQPAKLLSPSTRSPAPSAAYFYPGARYPNPLWLRNGHPAVAIPYPIACVGIPAPVILYIYISGPGRCHSGITRWSRAHFYVMLAVPSISFMVLTFMVAMLLMTLSLALGIACTRKQCTAEAQQYELFHSFLLL